MEVNVGFACYVNNEKSVYWKYLVTTIAQMLSKTNKNNFYNVYIVTNCQINWMQYIKKWYKFNNFKVTAFPPNNDFDDKKTHRWTKGVWYKMMLIKYLPKCEKLFACDTDLFFEFDIADLCSIDNKKIHLIGKIDTMYLREHFNEEPWKTFRKINAKTGRVYINAGFILLNPALILKDGYYKKLVNTKNSIYMLQNEQSCLNFLPLKTENLPFYCNFYYSGAYKDDNKKLYEGNYHEFLKMKHKKIIHFLNPKIWTRHFSLNKDIRIWKDIRTWKKIFRKIFKNYKT